ncbi:hypothetical protein [Yersinia enterocolitica]|uniref:hypothetical protein n=1 Tax=Yersinia enterocolitica TaxID=630 RepID=UPI003D028A66
MPSKNSSLVNGKFNDSPMQWGLSGVTVKTITVNNNHFQNGITAERIDSWNPVYTSSAEAVSERIQVAGGSEEYLQRPVDLRSDQYVLKLTNQTLSSQYAIDKTEIEINKECYLFFRVKLYVSNGALPLISLSINGEDTISYNYDIPGYESLSKWNTVTLISQKLSIPNNSNIELQVGNEVGAGNVYYYSVELVQFIGDNAELISLANKFFIDEFTPNTINATTSSINIIPGDGNLKNEGDADWAGNIRFKISDDIIPDFGSTLTLGNYTSSSVFTMAWGVQPPTANGQGWKVYGPVIWYIGLPLLQSGYEYTVSIHAFGNNNAKIAVLSQFENGHYCAETTLGTDINKSSHTIKFTTPPSAEKVYKKYCLVFENISDEFILYSINIEGFFIPPLSV